MGKKRILLSFFVNDLRLDEQVLSLNSMSQPIRIAVADDHKLFRQGLVEIIRESDQFDVCAEVKNGQELIAFLENCILLPDICLVDVSMPVLNGFETLKIIKAKYPSQKVLLISMFSSLFNICKGLKDGANGFFLKELSAEKLLDALNEIYENGFYAADFIPRDIVNAAKRKSLIHLDFTEKQLKFLKLCCSDKSYSEIAEELGVSPRTIDSYRETLFTRLNVRSRVGLAMFATHSGIVNPWLTNRVC